MLSASDLEHYPLFLNNLLSKLYYFLQHVSSRNRSVTRPRYDGYTSKKCIISATALCITYTHPSFCYTLHGLFNLPFTSVFMSPLPLRFIIIDIEFLVSHTRQLKIAATKKRCRKIIGMLKFQCYYYYIKLQFHKKN